MTTTDPTATAPQPATPGEALDLDAVEARLALYADLVWQVGDPGYKGQQAAAHACADDVPALVAQVRWLRAELDEWASGRRRWVRGVVTFGDGKYTLTEDAPAVYALPAEPPATYVYSLWDVHGCRWTRHAAAGYWELARAAPNPGHGYWHVDPESIAPWQALVAECGPLSTTPPAGTEAG